MGEGWEVNTSWLSEDGSKVCGYSTDNYNGYQYGGAYVEMDFISGKQVVKTEYDISVGPVFNVAALNYADGYIYGFGFDPSGNPVWKTGQFLDAYGFREQCVVSKAATRCCVLWHTVRQTV